MSKWTLSFDFTHIAVKVYAPTGVLAGMVDDLDDIEKKIDGLGEKLGLSEAEKLDLYQNIKVLFYDYQNGKLDEDY